MVENKPKTAEQRAEEAVTKKLGNAIACRMLKIRRYQASIKKLEKEIKKIKEGELVPEDEDEDGDESPLCSCKKCHHIKETVIERDIQRVIQPSPYIYPQPTYRQPGTNPYVWSTTTPNIDSRWFSNSTSLTSTNTLFPKKK